jgi:hypothetical protein
MIQTCLTCNSVLLCYLHYYVQSVKLFHSFIHMQCFLIILQDKKHILTYYKLTHLMEINTFAKIQKTKYYTEKIKLNLNSIILTMFQTLPLSTECAAHLVESTDWDRDCSVCMGYNRALVIMFHTPLYNVLATTALLLLAILLLTSNQKPDLRMWPENMSYWIRWLKHEFQVNLTTKNKKRTPWF